MDWLKEVIENKEIKDDMVVTLAGGKTVPVGEIRNLTKSQQKLLADREANLTAQEAQLKKNLETLQAAQAETARLYAELEKNKGDKAHNDDNNKADPLEALEKDPVLGILAKSLRQQVAAQEELKSKALAPLTKAIQDMASTYVTDRIEMDYDRFIPDAKKKDISLEAILKVANDNNLKTKSGIPDIRRAYQQISTKPMTQEDIDKQIADARADERKKVEEANRLRVPRPGIGSPRVQESGFKPALKPNSTVSSALSEALEAAAKDSEIWANVDNGLVQ